MIILSQRDRDVFAAWSEQEAGQNDALATQAMNLPGGNVIAAKLRTEAMATKVVARMLRTAEEKTLTSGDAAGVKAP